MSAMTEPTIKVTYFNIEGAAEKVRLALTLVGLKFEDERIAFQDWPALKPTLPNGQMPVMVVNDKMHSQSPAMMRWIARQGDGSLYPTDNSDLCMDIDTLIGLHDDDSRAFGPALYINMMPQKYGYSSDFASTEEGKALVKSLRNSYMENDFPRYMEHLSKAVTASGGPFLCGAKPTLADLFWLPRIRQLSSGVLEHISTDAVDKYPQVTAWRDALMTVPEIKAWYAVDHKNL